MIVSLGLAVARCEVVLPRQTPADFEAATNNAAFMEHMQGLMGAWCKQIEQVLAESEQMRKEADDVGPRAELEHWKQRMAKFNGLLDQIKGARPPRR